MDGTNATTTGTVYNAVPGGIGIMGDMMSMADAAAAARRDKIVSILLDLITSVRISTYMEIDDFKMR